MDTDIGLDFLKDKTKKNDRHLKNKSAEDIKVDVCFEAIKQCLHSQPGFSAGNIASFDYYLKHDLVSIINNNSVLHFPQCTIRLTDVQLGVCSHVESDGSVHDTLPNECRLRNLTYGCPIFVNVIREPTAVKDELSSEDSSNTEVSASSSSNLNNSWRPTYSKENIRLCFHPILVKSANCALSKMSNDEIVKIAHEDPADPGGYAIVRGTERELCSIRKMLNNHIHISKKAQAPHAMWNVEIRSTVDYAFRPTSTIFFHMPCADSPQKVTVLLPYLKRDVPLLVLFKAFDVHDLQLIWHYIYDLNNFVFLRKPDSPMSEKVLRDWLQPTIEDLPTEVQTKEDALEYIASLMGQVSPHREKRLQDTSELLRKEFLPHMEEIEQRLYYTGFVFCKLMRVFFKKDMDDRDDLAFQKIEQSGILFGSLFRMYFKKYMIQMRKMIQKELDKQSNFSCKNLFERNSKSITQGLKYALSTGNWGMLRNGKTAKTGVTQTVNRLNIFSFLSNLRRLRTPLGRDGKLPKPRQLHPSAWGNTDPSHTPEGADCGLVSHFSVLATVSQPCDPAPIIDYCRRFANVQPISISTYKIPSQKSEYRQTLVFVDGALIGFHYEPEKLVYQLRMVRRCQYIIDRHVAIVHFKREHQIWIRCDRGRVMHPVFVVDRATQTVLALEHQKEGLNTFHWHEWWQHGWLDYMDAAEMQTVRIAESFRDLQPGTSDYDYCEIDPSIILGVISNLIPYVGYNQSPRVTYQDAMRQQCIATPMHNGVYRMDTQTMKLDYPQKPLVRTRYESILQLDYHSGGQEYIAAILNKTGTQEDAVIINQGAIDRGLGRITIIDTYKTTANKPSTSAVQQRQQQHQIPVWMKPDEKVLSTLGASKQQYIYEKLDFLDGLVSPGEKVADFHAIAGKFTPIKQGGANKRANDILLSSGNDDLLSSTNGRQEHQKSDMFLEKTKSSSQPHDIQHMQQLKDDQLLHPVDDEEEEEEIEMEMEQKQAIQKSNDFNQAQHQSSDPQTVHVSSDEYDDNNDSSTTNDMDLSKLSRAYKEEQKSLQRDVKYQNNSLYLKNGKGGVVDSVMITDNEIGQTLVKISIRSSKKPEIGDKFAAAPGQKGVCGDIKPEVDMPFTSSGMRPDIIISAHAFPSRMTVGEWKEGVDGKAAALMGMLMDATAFKGKTMDEFVSHLLCQKGYNPDGTELMMSGETGEIIGPVTLIPIYYQRLKHLADAKHHARSTGPVRADTRQPLEGRCRDGGLRYGEMERDNGISHGVSSVLHDRLFKDSDPYSMWICNKCGHFGQSRQDEQNPFCFYCKTAQHMTLVEIPYASKLLMQETAAMHVFMKLHTEKNNLF